MTEFTLNRASKLPLVGPWIGRVGHVVDILATPCSVTPTIWILAGLFGAGKILDAYTKPFLIAWTWYRFGRSHRKGKRLKQIWDLVSHTEGIYEYPAGFGWRVFAIATDLILKAEWYFLLIDEATKGAVIWASLAYKWSGCKAPGAPYAEAALINGLLTLLPAGTYFVDTWMETGHNQWRAGPSGIQTTTLSSASCGFHVATGYNPFYPTLPTASGSFWLQDDANGVVYGTEPTQAAGKLNVTTFMHRDYLDGRSAHLFRVHYSKGFGIFWGVSGGMTATGDSQKANQLLHDP